MKTSGLGGTSDLIFTKDVSHRYLLSAFCNGSGDNSNTKINAMVRKEFPYTVQGKRIVDNFNYSSFTMDMIHQSACIYF